MARAALFSIAFVLSHGLVVSAAQSAECRANTPEQNAAMVRSYVDEVYNNHAPQKAAEYLSDDFNRRNAARSHNNKPGTADDVARIKRSISEFPDLSGHIEDLISAGDRVVVRLTIAGTHRGPFRDIKAPATNRKAVWQAIIIWRIACGKLAENWVVADRFSELRQLGIITDDELATIGEPSVKRAR
jgi:predicted ester cyclase